MLLYIYRVNIGPTSDPPRRITSIGWDLLPLTCGIPRLKPYIIWIQVIIHCHVKQVGKVLLIFLPFVVEYRGNFTVLEEFYRFGKRWWSMFLLACRNGVQGLIEGVMVIYGSEYLCLNCLDE